MADRVVDIGFAEVGISLDGTGDRNDLFRGQKGAFEAAFRGIRTCLARGQRVSLRLTVTCHNCQEIPAIFKLGEEKGIHRLCFYHLAYPGRANSLRGGTWIISRLVASWMSSWTTPSTCTAVASQKRC